MNKKIYYWILITERKNPVAPDYLPNEFLNGGYENKKTAIGQAVLFKKNRDVEKIEIYPLPTPNAVTANVCVREFKELKKLFEEQI